MAPGDTIANFDSGNAWADLGHDTRCLLPWNKRQLRRIASLAQVNVDEIDSAGLDFDEYLGRSRVGMGSSRTSSTSGPPVLVICIARMIFRCSSLLRDSGRGQENAAMRSPRLSATILSAMQPDNLISLKDDMVAFIAGHGMRRFNGYITEEVPTVIFEDEDPDSWKDFVEHAKAAGATFVTMSEVVLEKSDVAILLDQLRDQTFPDSDAPELDDAEYLVNHVGKVGYLQLGFAHQGDVPLRDLYRVVRALPGTHRVGDGPWRHRG